MKFKEIHCFENYSQFDGEFFVWPYLSMENINVPEFWRFFLPDGRIVEARVRCTFTQRQTEGDNIGANAITGKSTAEFLVSMFATKEKRFTTGTKWQQKMINQIKKYYDSEPELFVPPKTPFGNKENDNQRISVAENGYFSVLIMTKHIESTDDE